MSPAPQRLVLIGHPVSHSLSPVMQNAALTHANIPLRYEAIDVAEERDVRDLLAQLVRENSAGNVTVPHKQLVYGLCDSISEEARRVGAVNAFWTEGGRLHGDNTDVAGFDTAVRSVIDPTIPRLHVTLVGAGGAARAIAAAVSRWPEVKLTIWNRSHSRALALAQLFGPARVETDLARAVQRADLVINATSVGLSGYEFPVSLDAVDLGAAVYDLVYRPGRTPWVNAAREEGRKAEDGLGMLVEQGALAFERWLGTSPDRGVMWNAVKEAASAR